METDSSGEMMSSWLGRRLLLLHRLRRPSSSPFSSLFRSLLTSLLSSSSMGVSGRGDSSLTSRSLQMCSHTVVLTPKDWILSSRKSSDFSVINIAPLMSFSTNFSAIMGSTPALSIHWATFSGDHETRSLESSSSWVNWNGLARDRGGSGS
jgi:hypothetical protein